MCSMLEIASSLSSTSYLLLWKTLPPLPPRGGPPLPLAAAVKEQQEHIVKLKLILTIAIVLIF